MTCEEHFRITTTLDPRNPEQVTKALLAAVIAHALKCPKCSNRLQQRKEEIVRDARVKYGKELADVHFRRLQRQGEALVDDAIRDPEVVEVLGLPPNFTPEQGELCDES